MKLNRICKYCYLFIFTLLFVFLLKITSLSAKEVDNSNKFNLTAKTDWFLTLSSLEGDDSLLGGNFDALIAPYYKINDKLQFIFLYDGNYYKQRGFYSDGAGPRERDEYMGHNLTPMLSIKLGQNTGFTIIPSLFYAVIYNKDIVSDDWSDGLYNYNDIGAGVDFTGKRFGFSGADGILKLGFQVYHRTYPNYISLLDLATGIDVEEDEKDNTAIIISIGYDWIQKIGFSWNTNYNLFYKMLDDKKVVDLNGVLTDEERKDQTHLLNFSFWYLIKSDLKIGFDLLTILNRSNQNYYDGMGTIEPDDDYPISKHYDYNAYTIRPNMTYQIKEFPILLSLSFSNQKTEYLNREAKDTYRQYKSSESHWETQQELLLKIQYEINKNWQAIGKIQNVTADSNTEDESVYKYSYTVNNYSIGVSYKY